MPDIDCRVAKLEQKMENYDHILQNHLVEEEKATVKLFDKLDVIEESLAKQKGFIGGVTFTISAIVGAIGLAISFFYDKN